MRLLLLALLFFSTSALASPPFVVSDLLASGVSLCGVYMDAAPKATIPVAAVTGGNICKLDIGTISVGTHTVTMTAISVNDPIWGSQESAPSLPLSFTKQSPPAAPTGLKLIP
jgi:hypothetical protein